MSRGRKRPKSRSTGVRVIRPAAPAVEVEEPCDCPACSGEEFDPQELVGDLLAGAAELVTAEDPLDAELFGAAFAAAGLLAGDGFAEALAPAVAAAGSAESLAVLLALDAVGAGPTGAAEIKRLIAAGVPAPGWAAELREPVRVDRCLRFTDVAGGASMLVCLFERAGRAHGFVVHIDHTDCDAAVDIMLVPGEIIDEVIESLRTDGRSAGAEIQAEELDLPEFRWLVERALDAREVHDDELDDEELAEDLGDEEGPGYLPMAVLLRARIRELPEPTRPAEPHGTAPEWEPAPPEKLPPKRKKSSGTAPIYRIKVGLAGTEPAVWRRLELPADTGLTTLHDIIQVAFDWSDSHIHVFETPYGAFGVADRELGHRAEKPVTLEQVAPAVGAALEYIYDFGDDWTHEIVVEEILDRDPGATYPRCTDGGRAAPPEDCGGSWGYADLLDILADPAHEDHAERLEWLSLRSAAEFHPDSFEPAQVTETLTGRSPRG